MPSGDIIYRSNYPDVALSNLNLWDFAFHNLAANKDVVAFIDAMSGRQMTQLQVYNLSKKIAAGLHQRGFKHGDVVMTVLPNLLEVPSIYYGVAYGGCIISPCSPLSTEEELLKQMKDCKAKMVITIGMFLEPTQGAVKAYGEPCEIVLLGSEEPGTTPFTTLIDNNGELPIVKVSPDDIMAIPYSSGTTGLPKGVVLNHRSLTSNCLIVTSMEAGFNRKTDRYIAIIPFFHIYGFTVFINTCLFGGKTVVIMPRFEPEAFFENIVKYRCTHLVIVPPIVLLMAKDPSVLNYDLKHVRVISSGAAPLGAETELEISKRFPWISVRQGYGMTELPSCALMVPHWSNKPGSSGILPPNITAKIVDTATGLTLGENQDGELCFKSPAIMSYYLNRPDAGIIDQDGYLHTGDIGYIDTDGFFYVVDRVKELIKYKGFQVPPAELEALILSHPKVADVAVVGKPDLEAGELPTAFVVLKPDITATPKEISDFVASKVSHYKRLCGGVIFTDTIPKSLAGKILRRILKQQLITSKL